MAKIIIDLDRKENKLSFSVDDMNQPEAMSVLLMACQKILSGELMPVSKIIKPNGMEILKTKAEVN